MTFTGTEVAALAATVTSVISLAAGAASLILAQYEKLRIQKVQADAAIAAAALKAQSDAHGARLEAQHDSIGNIQSQVAAVALAQTPAATTAPLPPSDPPSAPPASVAVPKTPAKPSGGATAVTVSTNPTYTVPAAYVPTRIPKGQK